MKVERRAPLCEPAKLPVARLSCEWWGWKHNKIETWGDKRPKERGLLESGCEKSHNVQALRLGFKQVALGKELSYRSSKITQGLVLWGFHNLWHSWERVGTRRSSGWLGACPRRVCLLWFVRTFPRSAMQRAASFRYFCHGPSAWQRSKDNRAGGHEALEPNAKIPSPLSNLP